MSCASAQQWNLRASDNVIKAVYNSGEEHNRSCHCHVAPWLLPSKAGNKARGNSYGGFSPPSGIRFDDTAHHYRGAKASGVRMLVENCAGRKGNESSPSLAFSSFFLVCASMRSLASFLAFSASCLACSACKRHLQIRNSYCRRRSCCGHLHAKSRITSFTYNFRLSPGFGTLP